MFLSPFKFSLGANQGAEMNNVLETVSGCYITHVVENRLILKNWSVFKSKAYFIGMDI